MKYKIHIPTEQFGFIEVDVEGTPEEVYNEYHELKFAFSEHEGLDTQEFNKALDRYLTNGTGETDTYLRMSKPQQAVFQEIKKSFKRINK